RVLDLDDPDHPTGSQQVIDAPVRTPLGDAPPPPPRTSLPPPPPPPRSSDHRVPRRSLADRRPRGRRT
ncbi:MAG: hypothetical protein ACTMKU_06190, partial [Actinomycetaceae bacterium]